MNLCRTCKYWSCNSHTIGSGHCVNVEAHLRVLLPNTGLVTSQDFGCVLHEAGPSPQVLSEEQHRQVVREFINWVK